MQPDEPFTSASGRAALEEARRLQRESWELYGRTLRIIAAIHTAVAEAKAADAEARTAIGVVHGYFSATGDSPSSRESEKRGAA